MTSRTPTTGDEDVLALFQATLQNIANELNPFGGILRCSRCGIEGKVGDVSLHFRDGWPTHCGYTMTWVTQLQLDEASVSPVELRETQP